MPDPRPADETFAVELTPSGRGAVAVVVVAGPDATRVVGELFASASGRPLAAAPIGRILFGRWSGADGEELVVYRCDQNQVEVHCHGGVAAVSSVMSELVNHGCRRLTWQEWLSRTATDPIRAAAQIALAEATTARTAAILLDQYNGALSAAIHSIIEAATAGDWPRAADETGALLAFREIAQHLTVPWRVVLAGPPNVGKSSLINALAGYERAIVAATPGTTRDVVTVRTAIEGWPVELADTAGLRPGEDEIESAGIALAASALATADLVLAVHDASATIAEQAGTQDVMSHVLAATRVINVWNKIDLVPHRSAASLAEATPRAGHAVITSAITGEGIEALVGAIATALASIAPPKGAALPFHSDHFAALDAARIGITRCDSDTVRRALEHLRPT